MNQYNLDFDGAYQCVVAEKQQLGIVSVDTNFDQTPLKRKMPEEAMLAG